MARIKLVLNERRLAYDGAMKLAEQQQAEAKLRQHEKGDWDIVDFMAQQQEAKQPPVKETAEETPKQ